MSGDRIMVRVALVIEDSFGTHDEMMTFDVTDKPAVVTLRQERDRLRKALSVYADPTEWHYTSGGGWRLLFNSTDEDAHGWERARRALGRPDSDPT